MDKGCAIVIAVFVLLAGIGFVFNSGKELGLKQGIATADQAKYDEGYFAGHSKGKLLGKEEGVKIGDAIGFKRGHEKGYGTGFSRGRVHAVKRFLTDETPWVILLFISTLFGVSLFIVIFQWLDSPAKEFYIGYQRRLQALKKEALAKKSFEELKKTIQIEADADECRMLKDALAKLRAQQSSAKEVWESTLKEQREDGGAILERARTRANNSLNEAETSNSEKRKKAPTSSEGRERRTVRQTIDEALSHLDLPVVEEIDGIYVIKNRKNE